MAYRLAESIIAGMMDFQVRGVVSGWVELAGVLGRIKVELKGCPWRDLAGFRLEFKNPKPVAGPHLVGLTRIQTGKVGDMTASRKVKIPEIPTDEILKYCKIGIPFPFHWANSLYLEWFSDTNGRVVIEAAEYDLAMQTDPTWTMTEAEELRQRAANGEALDGFMERMGGIDDGIEE